MKLFWVIIYAAVFLFSVTYIAMLFIIGQLCASLWTVAIMILSGYMLNRELKIIKWKRNDTKKQQSKSKRRSKVRKKNT